MESKDSIGGKVIDNPRTTLEPIDEEKDQDPELEQAVISVQGDEDSAHLTFRDDPDVLDKEGLTIVKQARKQMGGGYAIDHMLLLGIDHAGTAVLEQAKPVEPAPENA